MSTLQARANEVWSRIIKQESGGRQFAANGAPLTSSKGAIGRAQVMPATARRVATQMLGEEFDEHRYKNDPAYNERLGRTYFDWLTKRYGDTTLAAAAYNAGEGNVDKWLKRVGDPRRGEVSHEQFAAAIPFAETRNYVRNVAQVAVAGGVNADRFMAAASGTVRAEGTPFDSEAGDPNAPAVERSLGRFLKLTVGQDWSTSAIARIAQQGNIELDPNYSLPSFGSREWQDLTRDIPQEFWDSFGGALSAQHAQEIRSRVLAEVAAEQELAGYGGWGVAGRIAVNLADPGAWALAIGTGGLGVAAKGGRMLQVARSARIAGQLSEARTAVNAVGTTVRASPWANAGRIAAISGAENAALEGILLAGSETKDGWDVAFAGLAGVALGGTASRLFSGAEKRALTNAYLRERTALQHAELDAAISAKRARLLEDAGDVADLESAKSLLAEIRQLDDEIGSSRTRLGMVDAAALGDRITEVEANLAGLMSRGADPEQFEAIAEQLRKVEGELRGRGKQRRALTQEIKTLRRKGALVSPEEQLAKLRGEVDARLRGEDAKVWGDQVDSPAVARKRRREVEAEVKRLSKELPGDPRVARLEARLGDTAGAIERLSSERARLMDALGLSADARAAERELGALRRTAAEPDAERARLSELEARRKRAADEQARLGKAGEAARDLEMLDELQARVRRLIDMASDRLDPPAVDINSVYGFGGNFGSDTLSAARYSGDFEGISDELIESGAEEGKEVGRVAFANLQSKVGTLGGILRGHENDLVRSRVGAYVGDSVGTADGSVSVIGASEVGNRLNETFLAKFNTAVEPAYDAWRKAEGHGAMKAMTRTTRAEFMEQVGRAIKGEQIDDPHVKAAAGKVRSLFAEYLAEAKAAGVKGFDNVEANGNYLPRFPIFEAIHRLENKIGTGNVVDFFKRAIKEDLADSMPEDAAATLAGKIANGYVLRMKKLRVGADAQLMNGVPLNDFAYLRHILEEAGESAGEIDSVLGKLAAYQAQRGKDGGKIRQAKHRVRFDETYTVRYRNEKLMREKGIEEWVDVKMSDLFENDVEQLFHRYSRTMSGHIGMAKAAGVKSVGDHQKNLEAIKRALEKSSPDEIDRVVKAADAAYKLVVGHPIEDPSFLQDVFRITRDYNFATTMNQAGFAQIPDLAGLISKGYLRHTMRHSGLGDLVKMMKRGDDGVLADEFARETEEWLGLGTDYHNNAIFASYSDDIDRGFIRGAMGKLHHGIRVAGRGTQALSGMAFITSAAQRLAGKAIVQRLVKETLAGGQISDKRLAQLGIAPEMKGRIGAQIKAHTRFVNNEVGGKVRAVNWAGWDDLEARDALLYAVFREARRLVQEEDLADTTLWMHKGWAKVLLQFRRFGLVSFTRQILHGANMRDAETGSRVLMSMGLAAAAYYAQMQVKVHGMPEEKREEFAERYMSPGALAAAAFSRSSYASMLPAMFDTLPAMVADVRLFDTRSSGLASDLITGNPTYALSKNLKQALSAPMQALLRDDRQFTQEDARALRRILPYQNLLGVDYLVNPLIEQLPKTDRDPDDDSVDWAF